MCLCNIQDRAEQYSVKNIRDFAKNKILKAITNNSSQLYKQLVELILFPIEAKYTHDSKANVISFKYVTLILDVRIKMNTENENAIMVTLKSGQSIYVFPIQQGIVLLWYNFLKY